MEPSDGFRAGARRVWAALPLPPLDTEPRMNGSTWLGLDLDTATSDDLAVAIARCLRENGKRRHHDARGVERTQTDIDRRLLIDARRYRVEADLLWQNRATRTRDPLD